MREKYLSLEELRLLELPAIIVVDRPVGDDTAILISKVEFWQQIRFTAYMSRRDARRPVLLTVDPVSVELVGALVESKRLASRHVDERQIIASRLQDLQIQFNAISKWNGWKRVAVP